MSLSSLQRRLLNFVTDEPQTATEIYRRFHGYASDSQLVMTSRMRRQRRELAATLEDLTAEGCVVRHHIERHGTQVPAFRRPHA